MISIEALIFVGAFQLGFAGIAIWLIKYVTRTGQSREDRLLTIIEQYNQQLESISHTLERLDDRMGDFEHRLKHP